MFRPVRMSRQTLLLLATFLEEPRGWRYGYDLSRATALKSGTLYPILMRLNKRGWLETRWAAPEGFGRPPRHMYHLTPDGLRFARTSLASNAARVLSRSAYGTARG
ncbi:MAG: PadR family transcriptional regulator [Candidatus Acidiferrales bacterium]